MRRAGIVPVAAAIVIWALTVGAAGAQAKPMHHCPAIRIPSNHITLRVERVSCRRARRLVLAWRKRIGERNEHCIPRNEGFAYCTIDRWRFACQQTPDGHEYPVTAVLDGALFRFAYPV